MPPKRTQMSRTAISGAVLARETARLEILDRALDRRLHLRPVLAFLPLDVAEQPGAFALRHAGDERATHRGRGDRQARALHQAQHRTVLAARELQIDQIEPIAR